MNCCKRTTVIFCVLASVVVLGGAAAYAWNSGGVARFGAHLGIDTGAPLFTFEGGKPGEQKVAETPLFDVKPDWSAEIELKGEFPQVTLIPEKPERGNESEWLNGSGRIAHTGTMNRDFTRGGRFKIQFFGDGVWRVTIRQGAGKI